MIRQVELKKTSNFFVMVQYEEVSFPSKRVRTEKFRTNICADSSSPVFSKNIFLFENVQISNRMTLKMGVFTTDRIDESMSVDEMIVSYDKQREMLYTLRCEPYDVHTEDDHPVER